MADETVLHSLIPLTEFKAILGIDDREDPLSCFVLTASTYTIEEYCKRRLLKKKCLEYLGFFGDYIIPLREYPVRKILTLYSIHPLNKPNFVIPKSYHTIPDCGNDGDPDLWSAPFCLSVSPRLKIERGLSALKIKYWAGYECGEVPPDLASACMELAAWNMSRYRGRRIGLSGAVRGKATDGEHLESSMPENVRLLLEPYRRKTI
ncbi:hypothetical protein FACS189485_08450 [Spirochaetia bacterium]|nr:hypothetical protein FACS189485_08450 [Spirochaetia bacterium]